MRQRVAELAALVDRARRLRRDVARDPARERELAEQLAHPVLVAGDRRVDLAVRSLEVRVGDDRRPAVPGPDDVDRVEVAGLDDPVHVDVDHVQAGGRAPVPEEARLDVVRLQGAAQHRVVEQVDLADRQVVGGTPVRVEQVELVRGQGPGGGRGKGVGRGHRGASPCGHHSLPRDRFRFVIARPPRPEVAFCDDTRGISPGRRGAGSNPRRREGSAATGGMPRRGRCRGRALPARAVLARAVPAPPSAMTLAASPGCATASEV